MLDYSVLIANATRRVVEAREIAAKLRGDNRLHRLSMETVFVLEDVLASLTEMAAERDRTAAERPGIAEI